PRAWKWRGGRRTHGTTPGGCSNASLDTRSMFSGAAFRTRRSRHGKLFWRRLAGRAYRSGDGGKIGTTANGWSAAHSCHGGDPAGVEPVAAFVVDLWVEQRVALPQRGKGFDGREHAGLQARKQCSTEDGRLDI